LLLEAFIKVANGFIVTFHAEDNVLL
jgi:hypothetical protein